MVAHTDSAQCSLSSSFAPTRSAASIAAALRPLLTAQAGQRVEMVVEPVLEGCRTRLAPHHLQNRPLAAPQGLHAVEYDDGDRWSHDMRVTRWML